MLVGIIRGLALRIGDTNKLAEQYWQELSVYKSLELYFLCAFSWDVLNISSLMNSLKQILYELIQFFFINSLQAITIQEEIVINEPITSK